MDYLNYYNYLTSWLKNEVTKAGAKGVIIGISGGIDSAVVGAIAKKAFPNNSIGIMMPISNREFDKIDGVKLCEKIGLEYSIVDLKKECQELEQKLGLSNNLAKLNLQARLRMSTLYALAQEKSYLVLGTDNYAEYYLGYFTKYGDGGCDLLPIVQLHKSEVYKMAELLELPKSIIEKAPSAGMWNSQEDEKELGFKYSDFELFVNQKKVSINVATRILKLHQATEHKRQPIPKPLKTNEYLK